MNDEFPTPPISPDDLAAYALDAHDAEDAAAIAAHLDTSPDAVRREHDLRAAAGEYASAVVDEVAPDPDLRGPHPRRGPPAPPRQRRRLPAPRPSTFTASRWRGRSCCYAT